ncbi:MAG: 23S rRNA (guanosine(2251)-2'-O)-methyltransferase RlmB [Nitrospiraceae bacterium]|nr:23S rRNA (guanosine(2251)-2'-O)-methyltransferase RlmB [Nitrospiraceae bacterium]
MEKDMIYGVNPVLEALRAGVALKVFISGSRKEGVALIEELAGKRGAPVQRVGPSFFETFPKGHQSVAARVRWPALADAGQMLEAARAHGEPPLIVALDGVEDPRNLGAIMRSALALGAHGIIIPKRHGAGLSPEAVKASAGAAWGLPVSVQSNIKYSLDELKEKGLLICGAQVEGGIAPWQCDLSQPMALVLGAEQRGLRRVVAQRCDYLLSVPMRGINSLNVSVGAGILLFEILRQRNSKKDKKS